MSNKMRFTILGCGSSPGTPRIHGDWGDCDPANPKNRRLRCSMLVERISAEGRTVVVVDTSPDFRQQMLGADVKALDAVLYTHPHADHIHGIDDLRGFAMAQRERIKVYADAATMARLHEGFGYCFRQPEGSIYPPILNAHEIIAKKPIVIEGKGGAIHVLPIMQVHGPIHSLGFRFSTTSDFKKGGLCYSPDLSDIPQDSVPMLKNLDWWVVDALQYKPHVSHFNVSDALEWIEKLTPENAIITHMHIPLDYSRLKEELPGQVEPAFDGMQIELHAG